MEPLEGYDSKWRLFWRVAALGEEVADLMEILEGCGSKWRPFWRVEALGEVMESCVMKVLEGGSTTSGWRGV